MTLKDPSIEVSVSIEATLHKAFSRVLQEVADEYGICVTRVCVDWTRVKRMGAETTHRLSGLNIVTESGE